MQSDGAARGQRGGGRRAEQPFDLRAQRPDTILHPHEHELGGVGLADRRLVADPVAAAEHDVGAVGEAAVERRHLGLVVHRRRVLRRRLDALRLADRERSLELRKLTELGSQAAHELHARHAQAFVERPGRDGENRCRDHVGHGGRRHARDEVAHHELAHRVVPARAAT